MIRLLLKSLMPVVMLIGIASYMLYLKGIDPTQPWRNFTSGLSLSTLLTKVENPVERINSTADSGIAYRWRDDNGNISMGDRPPEDARDLTVVFIDQGNVIPAFSASEPAASDFETAIAQPSEPALSDSQPTNSQSPIVDNALDVYDPDNIQELIEQAHALAEQARSRQAIIETR